MRPTFDDTYDAALAEGMRRLRVRDYNAFSRDDIEHYSVDTGSAVKVIYAEAYWGEQDDDAQVVVSFKEVSQCT